MRTDWEVAVEVPVDKLVEATTEPDVAAEALVERFVDAITELEVADEVDVESEVDVNPDAASREYALAWSSASYAIKKS